MTGIEPEASFRPLPEPVPVGDLVARVGEQVEVLGDARRPIRGIGALHPFRRRASIARVVPRMQRRLAVVAVGSFLLLAAVVAVRMLTTSFRLG